MKRFLLAIFLIFSAACPASAGDHAFGDSVTFSTAAADAMHGFVALLQSMTGRALTNHGVSGDMVADGAAKVYGVTPGPGDNFTTMWGINDERIYCPSPCSSVDATKQGYYRRGYEALVAWLALQSKQLAISSGTYTGTWVATTPYGIGKNSTTNGSTATFTVSGTVVYIGMIQQDGATGTFDIKIDGTTVESGTTQTTGLGPTVNGLSYGPMLKRYGGLALTSHTVQIVDTSATGAGNTVYVDWVASNTQIIKPYVYVGNVLRAAAYSTGGSDTGVAAYNSSVSALVTELAGDGLRVYLVDASGAINQSTDMDGAYHPVNSGHAKIANTFFAAIPALTYSPAIAHMWNR